MILTKTFAMCEKENQTDWSLFLICILDQDPYGYITLKLISPQLHKKIDYLFELFHESGIIKYDGQDQHKYLYKVLLRDDEKIAYKLSSRGIIDRILLEA